MGLFLLGIHAWSFAQEYSLTLNISDQETEEPLNGVTVLITPCNCGGISNASGIFSKRLPKGKYQLRVEYLNQDVEDMFDSFCTFELSNIQRVDEVGCLKCT